MTTQPKRDPKYSGWPGPEPVDEITPHGEPYQPPEAPKPKKKAKLEVVE